MDVATISSNTSITNRKRKADEIDLPIILSKCSRFFDSFYRQSYSLPDSLMYYISKDRKRPELYQKMLQTCRQFFIRNPILIFQGIDINYLWSNWHFLFKGANLGIANLKSKIWINNRLSINGYDTNENKFNVFVISKIYQCDVKELQLSGLRMFQRNLKFLARKCEKVRYSEITVIKEDGSVGALENIFEVLPKVKTFYCTLGDNASNIITQNTVKNFLQIPHFFNLDEFTLNNIPEVFDIAIFYNYIKGNKKTSIRLEFCSDLSEAYKLRLQTIVNEIITRRNRNFKAPCIDFLGRNQPAWLTMWKLYMMG